MLTVESKYESLLQQPSKQRYLELRKLLTDEFGAASLAPLLTLQREIRTLGKAPEYVERRINKLSSRWLLSPRFHRLIAEFAVQTSDFEQNELSLFEADRCLQALLATGDGTQARPFISTYPSDIGDVASALGKNVIAQHLVHRNDDWFDLATCDETEIWFARPLAPVEIPA